MLKSMHDAALNMQTQAHSLTEPDAVVRLMRIAAWATTSMGL